MNVVVVEDHADLLELLRLNFEEAGHSVRDVSDHFDRLFEPAFWTGIDVAVVDIMLPKVDGREVLAFLRRRIPSVRRIAFSALPESTEIPNADVVIRKPAPMASLLAALGG